MGNHLAAVAQKKAPRASTLGAESGWRTIRLACGGACLARSFFEIGQFLLSVRQGLLLGVNVILLFATILGELALVAEARPGVGVVRSRAQFLLALQDVEFTLEGGNFLLLRFDLSCPLLRLLFRIVRRLRLAGVGSFGVAGL